MFKHYPTVERLELHLEGNHKVYCEKGNEAAAVRNSESKLTKLLGWFAANDRFVNARFIPYTDFPKYFTWNKTDRMWKPRAKYKAKNSGKEIYDFTLPPHGVVGRMYNISPREGERYFLRTLLLHRPGITSLKHMRNVDGKQYSSFREACCAIGLLADDAEWIKYCMMHLRLHSNH